MNISILKYFLFSRRTLVGFKYNLVHILDIAFRNKFEQYFKDIV